MEHISGIGGYFLRATDPSALGAWYRDRLGLAFDHTGMWRQDAGPTVFGFFASDTDYFGSRTQQTMLNLRVDDLGAVVERLRREGVTISSPPEVMPGVGVFASIVDPEGNRIELWEPERD
ncbi:VOC family protein [Williamsia sterculiae]|uniref:VOC domain-containing protein n=1 Tax=Williamsia sterculiae TaxID=1344003 RepID=A0A1N7CQ16_9NOCA|nr:VOC family protein [Williamsia sterculiae]SIR65607.1 hypothetical protein SAMN05445060_0280 [Williamsia sterculiae]